MGALLTISNKEEAIKKQQEINIIVANQLQDLAPNSSDMMERIKQKFNDLLWKYKVNISASFKEKMIELEDKLID